jgi:hypothetical protein
MTYSAEISRDHPACILFLIDQSGSMAEAMTSGRSKSQFVADALNKAIYTLVTNCTKSDGVRSYFDVGVIGYNANGPQAGFGGALAGKVLYPITVLADAPLRVEDRIKKEDDGAGGIFERRVRFPVWFEAVNAGGTPMRAALIKAAEVLVDWCNGHPASYPPTVIHLTDGGSTDGDPSDVATAIKQIATNDGTCLLFNIHTSVTGGHPIAFPASDAALPDDFARMLFDNSSVLPPHVAKFAAEKYAISAGSKGFAFNAGPEEIVNFFDIGTRPRLVGERWGDATLI